MMRNFFKPAFTTSMYKKMFLRHFLQLFLIFVTLFLIGVCTFSYQSHQHKKELLRQSADSLSDFSEGLLRECQTIAFNVGRLEPLLALSASGNPYLNFSQTDSTIFFNAQHDLISHKALNRHISSMSVYLTEKEYIISDHGTITLESFCQSVFNTDSDTFADYLRPLTPGYYLFLPQGAIAETNTPLQSVYILPLINSNGSHYGTLFLFLDDAQILKELDALVGENIEYFILGENHSPLFLPPEEKASLSAATLARLTSDNRYLSAADTHSGWTHYVGYSKDFLQKQLWLCLLLFTVIFLVGVCLQIPLANAICKKNYAPIRELSSMITDTASAAAHEPEYETLKSTVSAILENKALLEQQLSLYKPVLINSFLLELLSSNNGDDAQVLRGLSSLGVRIPFSICFCVALIAPTLTHGYWYQLAKSQTTESVVCLYLSCRKHVGVLFFNCADKQQALLSQKAVSDILEQEEGVCSYGIGSMSEDLKYAPISYSQAICTIDYFSLQTEEKAISFDALFAAQVLNLPTPETLKSLDASFSAFRFQTAKENFSEYFRLISKSGYGKKEHLTYAQKQLLLAASKLPQEYQSALDTEALRALNTDARDAFATLSELCAQTLDKLTTLFEQSSKEQSKHASRRILEWLDEHLCDENLSLSYFAEAFSLSESQMSRKIKALTGENFLSYVNQKRIEHACTLLTTTDLPVLQIANSCGYENDITFRRIFKKYIGVTPGEYRRHQMN